MKGYIPNTARPRAKSTLTMRTMTACGTGFVTGAVRAAVHRPGWPVRWVVGGN